MAIGRPAIETAAAEAAEDAAAVAGVGAVFVATIPKLGSPALAALTVSVALCAFEDAAGATVRAASRRAVARFAAGKAAITCCDAVASAVGVCWPDELPGVRAPAAVFVEGPDCSALAPAVAVLAFCAGCVVD